jgi:hypothetical protein
VSITLGDAILWLRADDSKMESGLRGAETKTKSWVSGLGGAVQTGLGFVIGGAINAGIGAITSSFGALKDGMIGGNAAFEQYNTQFEVLLGSAEAAKDRMADLAEFGQKTPFELPQVVEADRILQGFGLHSEEAAKKFGFSGEQIRTIAGDVASGTGSNFQEMALLIGKFSSGATGETIARMQELGITNREELAKMGLEFSKSGQLLSPLPESMNVILQLMQEKYGGLMDAQSKTFTGMMSNLQDWIAGTLRTIGQPIFELLKDKLQSTLEFLASPVVQNAVAVFAQMLTTGIGLAMDWLNSTALPALQQFATWFMTVGWPAIQPFVTMVISQLVPGLQQLASWAVQIGQAALPILGQAFTFLMNNANIVLPILGAIGAVILAIASPVTALAGLVVLLATAWVNNWGNIQGITAGVLAFLQPYFDQLAAIFDRFITLLLPPLQMAWQTLVQVWQAEVGPALAQLWTSLQQLFAELGFGTGQTDIWQIALGALKLILIGVLLAVQGLTPIIRLAADVMVFMINQVKTAIDNFVTFKNGVQGIIEAVGRLIGKIGDMAAALKDLAIPDWLMPGSPTPFELGLRGIASAIDNLPDFPRLTAPASGGNGAAMSGGGPVGNISIVINGAGDPVAVGQEVQRVLAGLFNQTATQAF